RARPPRHPRGGAAWRSDSRCWRRFRRGGRAGNGSPVHYPLPVAAESASPPTAPETSHFLGLAKQTIVYGLSGVAIQPVGVITLPIYGHLFSQAEFGLLELATVLSAVALALIDAGFSSAAQRSFYDYTDAEHRSRQAVIFTAIAFTSALAALATLILL